MIAPKAATDTCFLHEQSFLAILEFVFVDLSNNLINKTPQKLKILWSHLLSPSVYLKAQNTKNIQVQKEEICNCHNFVLLAVCFIAF